MESQPRNPEFRINPENFHPPIIIICYIFGVIFEGLFLKSFNAVCPSQQFSSHVSMITCLPGLNHYKVADKVSCSRTQNSDSTGGESQTCNPSIPGLTLYQLSNCALLRTLLVECKGC